MAYESGPQGATRTILFTGSSVPNSTGFSSQTRQVRLAANAACNYVIGDGAQTATSASPFMPGNWYEYVTVTPGQQMAAIRSPTDGLVTSTSGTLWITEIG